MPSFGHGMLEHWTLDPDYTYLNHGTVGAPPRRVLARQQALRDEIERAPARFLLRELTGYAPAPWRDESRIREAARSVAPFVGSRPEDLVFVPNVTTGLNAVLQSVPLERGDEILMLDLAYGAILFAADVAARAHGAALRILETPYPLRDPAEIVTLIAASLTERTRLVVVDHITALSALVLPVAAVVAACHARGVRVLVDGAHAPGALAVDIPSLGADWYSANLHKWAHAPRPCAILWAAPGRQGDLHHPTVSWGRDQGFHAEFDLTATGDPTNYLVAPDAIALLQEWGFDAVLGYMHDLAWEAGRLLTEAWGTTLETPREMIGAMVTVPLPGTLGSTNDDATRLRLALLVENRIEVQLHAWHERLWVRISAQVYNDRSDITRLADAITRRVQAS